MYFFFRDDINWANLEKDLRVRNTAGSAEINEGVFYSMEVCLSGLEDGKNIAICIGE